MADKPKPIVIDNLWGGRNDTDAPLSLPMNQAVEFLNMDWKDATFGRKRGGATSVTDSGGTAFSSGLQTIFSHVPGAVDTAREFWGVDGAATPIVKRMAAGTSFGDVTLADAIATKPQDVVAVSLNGKVFLAYDSTADRLHAWDPSLASPSVRRVGLATSVAPTAANGGGGGAYAAVLRYYKQDTIQLDGTRVVRRSELSSAVSFTPGGASANATVTRGAFPNEGETHWRVWGSSDNTTFYNISGNIAVGTTTYADTATVASYSTNTAQEPAGTFTLPKSAKHLLSDGNRLLMANNWESGNKTSRVEFTAVLGSTDQGDDERVPNTTLLKYFVDLNENDGGGVTAMGGPLNGIVYVFKNRQVWKLTPTGDVNAPYVPKKLRDDIGCPWHKTVTIGEDQRGNAALYFLSHRGPYRISITDGIQYLGRDNETTWRSINQGATTVVAHSVFYPDLHQWWVWIATGSANDPDVKMMFDAQKGLPDPNNQIRGGWAKHTGLSAGARCSCLMSNTLGATMSRDLKPYIGRSSGTTMGKCDTSDTSDLSTAFQAYGTTRPLLTTPDLLRKVGVAESTVVAKVQANTTVSVTIDRDFGKETRAHTVSLVAAGSESRVVKKVEGSEMGEADVLQITIGDASAVASAWTVDALIAPVLPQETR